MGIILKLKISCWGRYIGFPVPLSLNQKVIDFCKNEKMNVTISNKGKSIKFIVKAGKFGSKTSGDRRIFAVPKILTDEVRSLCGDDTIRLTVEKRK